MLKQIALSKVESAPCACCGAASETSVWDQRVCYGCHAAWMADDRFSSGVINTALGISDRPEDFTTENAQYCAEAKARTLEWIAQRKTARAA